MYVIYIPKGIYPVLFIQLFSNIVGRKHRIMVIMHFVISRILVTILMTFLTAIVQLNVYITLIYS